MKSVTLHYHGIVEGGDFHMWSNKKDLDSPGAVGLMIPTEFTKEESFWHAMIHYSEEQIGDFQK